MKFTLVKPLFIILSLIVCGPLFLAIPIMLLVDGLVFVGLLFLVIWLVIFSKVINKCYSKRIIISDSGVTYINSFGVYELIWQDIRMIAVTCPNKGEVEETINKNPLVSPFTRRGYVTTFKKKTGKNQNILFYANDEISQESYESMGDRRFFMVNYREAVVNEIRKYWTQEIVGLGKN